MAWAEHNNDKGLLLRNITPEANMATANCSLLFEAGMATRRNTSKNQAIYALVSGAVDTLPEGLGRW